MRDALRVPDFRYLLAGDLVSNLGSWLLVVALPYRVFQLTGSATATGLALAAEALPALLAGPVAGVFVDRWDQRRLLIATNLARGVVLAGFLLADRPDRIGWVYATLFAESLGTMFFRPAARALRVAVLGTGPALAGGNALLGVAGGVIQLAGPPLGVVLLTAFGLPVLVFADMASYGVAAVAVALTGRRPATPRAGATVGGVFAELRDGLRVVTGRPVLRWLLLVCFTYFTANGVFTALLIPYMTSRFGHHPGAIGVQLSALGAGFLVGAPLGGRLARDRPPRLPLTAGLAGVGLCYAVLANAPAIPVAVIATGLAGLPGSMVLVTVETAIQRGAARELLGRVGATFYAGGAAADVAGALLGAGFGGTATALPTVLTVTAGTILLTSAVALFLMRDPTDRDIRPARWAIRGIFDPKDRWSDDELPGQRCPADRGGKCPERPGI
jgi:MFS family permease